MSTTLTDNTTEPMGSVKRPMYFSLMNYPNEVIRGTRKDFEAYESYGPFEWKQHSVEELDQLKDGDVVCVIPCENGVSRRQDDGSYRFFPKGPQELTVTLRVALSLRQW